MVYEELLHKLECVIPLICSASIIVGVVLELSEQTIVNSSLSYRKVTNKSWKSIYHVAGEYTRKSVFERNKKCKMTKT